MSPTGSQNSNKVIPQKYWYIPTELTNVLSLQDAADTYFYHRNTLLRRIKMGRLIGFKIRHRWFLDVSQLKKNATKTML